MCLLPLTSPSIAGFPTVSILLSEIPEVRSVYEFWELRFCARFLHNRDVCAVLRQGYFQEQQQEQMEVLYVIGLIAVNNFELVRTCSLFVKRALAISTLFLIFLEWSRSPFTSFSKYMYERTLDCVTSCMTICGRGLFTFLLNTSVFVLCPNLTNCLNML